ncbi:hypothetical protein J3E72DRAFT_338585 [Bipolaris maydis]|nr:hypothetical protein J3E72DRAFT_338585 [Bipolaris maydis]KAJ6206382.1 hypothetical protein PSV09DRAFT_2334173 [Bipolaris maydis]
MDHEAKGFRCTLPKRLTLLNGSHSFFFLIFFPSVNLMHCIFVSALLAFFFVSFIVIFFWVYSLFLSIYYMLCIVRLSCCFFLVFVSLDEPLYPPTLAARNSSTPAHSPISDSFL